MTTRNRNRTVLTLIAVVAMAVFAGAAQAGALRGQLGILTPETLAGNNPATGAPWVSGDQYRFVFHTSATTAATSADIATYNAWVQSLADATTVYDIGISDGVTWKAIGSTATVDARDNTSTNPTVETGCAIFLLDGSTVVANDYADLWDGEIQHIINLTEQGTEWAYWPWTGTEKDGTAATGTGGSGNPLGSTGEVGQGNASVTTDWIWRIWTMDPPGNLMPMYALSDPLVIVGGYPMATNPFPANGVEYGYDWVFLSWTGAAEAAEHDIYFGTAFDDVNDATASEPPVDPYKGRQTDTTYEVSVLEPGTTYYWRIDEVNDPNVWKGRVWSFWLRSWEPTNPNPPDGTTFVRTDADLSWNPGFQASMHEVFFGTDPCALASIYLSAAATCDPGLLLKGTTYYWQVKEYQPLSRRTLGPIWSFSTVPDIPITDPNLEGWWKLDMGEGDLALDSSGHDNHGTLTGDPQWVVGYDGSALEFDGTDDYVNIDGYKGVLAAGGIQQPFTVANWFRTTGNGEIVSWGTNAGRQRLSWRIDGGTLRTEHGSGNLRGNTTVNDGEWHHGALVVNEGANLRVPNTLLYVDGRQDTTFSGSDTTYNLTAGVDVRIGMGGPTGGRFFPGLIDDVRIYDRILSDKQIKILTGLFIAATNPNPYDTETGVSITPTLTWSPSVYAADTGGSHVFFSSNKAEVEDRSETVRTIVDGNSLPVGTLDFGKTYYWAVDSVNDVNTWPGDVWSFTVVEYLVVVVDDMEDYNDWTSIITVWRDGYRGPDIVGDSGANVTISTASDPRDPRLFGDGPPWPVRDSEAMQFAYDNDGSVTIYVPTYDPYTYSTDANYYSEAKAAIANLPIEATNWTEGGFKALTLWFYGDAGNAIEPMWIKLTDQGDISGKVAYGSYGEDTNDLKDPSWHEWNIALADFGVDLTQVKDISIGFGDESNRTTPGGSGVVFFDDIRLYTPRCILSLRSLDFARVDYVEDCVVDNKELELMAKNWLAAVPYMEPVPIDNPGFEQTELADGDWNWSMDNEGWGYFDNDGYQGSWNPGLPGIDDSGYGGNAPEGQNVGWANPGGVGVPGGLAQVLTDPHATLKADTTYTLIVEVGNPALYPWGGYSVQLLAGGIPHTPGTGADYTGPVTGGTLLAEDANSLTIAEDTFETSTVTYTYNPAHASLLGEPLQIRLLSLGNVVADDDTETDFDNVRLFQTSERVNLYDDTIINFRDYAVLADRFLDEDMFP